MSHTFDRLINTHLHNKIDKDKCLEIFLLKGNAGYDRLTSDVQKLTGKPNMNVREYQLSQFHVADGFLDTSHTESKTAP
jgi:metal-responsive CopG/Arc/MetJ family transcriptional regulator